MSETTSTPREDQRLGAARLLAYYGLLLLFILLLKTLLQELVSRYDLQQFQNVNESVKLALNDRAAFDTVMHTVFSLFLSLVFTLPLAWIYTLTKDDENFDPSLVQTLVVLSMTVTGVMIVVGTELARAFSLAGVVAAVRFRNTLDDPKDTVYVFIAIAIGMANGARAYPIAIWISIVMTATMYMLWKYHFGSLLRASSVRSRGRGKGKTQVLDWVRDEASLQTAQQALDQQVRLLQWASLPSKDKKKLNSALVVDATDLAAAQQHVDAALSSFGGRWRLASAATNGSGGVLEYVGRLPKDGTASALMATLRRDVPAGVSAMEYRSLKGLKPLPLPGSERPPEGTRADDDSY
jgi:uncharacterized protein DUF4956